MALPIHTLICYYDVPQRDMKVTIYRVEGKGSPVEIVSVPQRDLFRKYRWPAKGKIVAALQELEEA